MKVLRLEHENGDGVYHVNRGDWTSAGGRALEALGCPLRDCENHLLPTDDPKLGPKWEQITDESRWRFAYRDAEQLKRWWFKSEALSRLSQEGIRVAEYEVPNLFVRVGETQVVFQKDRAKRVGTLSPAALL